jgi:hypothetical protein
VGVIVVGVGAERAGEHLGDVEAGLVDRRHHHIAETGTVVTCTNEGNADLSGNVPPLQIHSIGIEKVVGVIVVGVGAERAGEHLGDVEAGLVDRRHHHAPSPRPARW